LRIKLRRGDAAATQYWRLTASFVARMTFATDCQPPKLNSIMPRGTMAAQTDSGDCCDYRATVTNPRLIPSEHPYRVTPIRAGGFRLDGGAMFGLIPRTIWETWIAPDAHNRIALATNCLLLDDGSRKVLVETGYGDKWSDKERAIYQLAPRTISDALREQGVEPESIDHVIVTHLHFDHAAGLTRRGAGDALERTFPNAEIVVQQREWDDAIANRSTMTRTYLPSHLEPIRSAVRLLDGPTEALPGIVVRPLVGHTWGQHGVFVRDERGGITVFPADLIPTRHHVHLAANMGYDVLPYENMLSKREFLAEAAGEGWRLVLDHEPSQPIVRAERDPADPSRHVLVPVAGESIPAAPEDRPSTTSG